MKAPVRRYKGTCARRVSHPVHALVTQPRAGKIENRSGRQSGGGWYFPPRLTFQHGGQSDLAPMAVLRILVRLPQNGRWEQQSTPNDRKDTHRLRTTRVLISRERRDEPRSDGEQAVLRQNGDTGNSRFGSKLSKEGFRGGSALRQRALAGSRNFPSRCNVKVLNPGRQHVRHVEESAGVHLRSRQKLRGRAETRRTDPTREKKLDALDGFGLLRSHALLGFASRGESKRLVRPGTSPTPAGRIDHGFAGWPGRSDAEAVWAMVALRTMAIGCLTVRVCPHR